MYGWSGYHAVDPELVSTLVSSATQITAAAIKAKQAKTQAEKAAKKKKKKRKAPQELEIPQETPEASFPVGWLVAGVTTLVVGVAVSSAWKKRKK